MGDKIALNVVRSSRAYWPKAVRSPSTTHRPRHGCHLLGSACQRARGWRRVGGARALHSLSPTRCRKSTLPDCTQASAATCVLTSCLEGTPQVKPIGYNWSYLACRIGHLVPIWQLLIESSFHLCTGHVCYGGGPELAWVASRPTSCATPEQCVHMSPKGQTEGPAKRWGALFEAFAHVCNVGRFEGIEYGRAKKSERAASAAPWDGSRPRGPNVLLLAAK
jgi:hypothetical protein